MDSKTEVATPSEGLSKRIQERIKIVDGLDADQQVNPRLEYFTTNNFIVVFKDGPSVRRGIKDETQGT